MSADRYRVVSGPDLRGYPNYSFELGDVDGDGRMEMASLDRSGNRLRVVGLDGGVRFERRLSNHGNWGTPLLCVADLDGDGRCEVVAPDRGRRFENVVRAFDARGEEVRSRPLGTRERDDYGIGIPLLAPARLRGGEPPCLLAALAGGSVLALDAEFRQVWRVDGLRRDFGHEFHVADVDGDGLDEVAFCTLEHIAGGYGEDGWNRGEFVVLDHDGRTLLRWDVSDYCRDSHFDDVAVADFRGVGRAEILLEKGILIDLAGEVVWDASNLLDHGQWIAHAPDPEGPGRLVFLSELWGSEGKSALFSGRGEKRMEIRDLPRSRLDPRALPGWSVLPTRPHAVRWTPEEEPEFFLAEQACSPTSHECFATVPLELRAFLLDLRGGLLATLPFRDAQVEGYWYNGEVHSRVADVDGDGRTEVVFPKQDGSVMIVKKGDAHG